MTGFEVLLAGAVVPGGVHPPVWPVVECVVYWMVTYFEVAVGFAAFAVGRAGVVVAASRELAGETTAVEGNVVASDAGIAAALSSAAVVAGCVRGHPCRVAAEDQE